MTIDKNELPGRAEPTGQNKDAQGSGASKSDASIAGNGAGGQANSDDEPFQIKRGYQPPPPSEPILFEVTGDNNKYPRKSQRNIRTALRGLGVTLRYDKFNDRVLVSGLAGHDILDDVVLNKLYLAADAKYSNRTQGQLLPPMDFFTIVLEDAAHSDAFHPVLDYLNALTWDGVPRLDRWLVDYAGADNTEYVCTVGSIALVAAVRRVRRPGCKYDEMLILEGPQGEGKSELLRALAGQDWFSDDLPLAADLKVVIERTRGKWIIEAAELSGMRRTDVEHLKSMLSRQVDRARLAYDRITSEARRQFIVIGTTNAEVYLKDTTGNRRYWPLRVTTLKVDELERDRDQLWAEAAQREAQEGASIRLERTLWPAAAAEQVERTVTDPWRELIATALDERQGKVRTADVWGLLGVDIERRTQEQNARLGNIMRGLGFKRKKLKFARENAWGYARGTEEEQRDEISLPM